MSRDSGSPERKLLTVPRMRLFSLAALALFCSAVSAQTPGAGETRPAPPSADPAESKDKLPKPAADSDSDRALARCQALIGEQRDECLRKERERSAAAGAGRTPE